MNPPVYFVHGLLGTAYGHFGAQIKAWQGAHRVIPVDLPGHGRCPLDAGPDLLDESLDYLLALLARFGAGRIVAASYLGGPLAVRCVTARPDLVRSLVLTGFAPDPDPVSVLAQLGGFRKLAYGNVDLAAEYDRLHTVRWRRTLAAFTDHVTRSFEETVLVRSRSLASSPVDVLILNGDLKSVERTAAERAGRLGQRVHGQVIPQAGHIASHDAPEPFTRAVEKFWWEDGRR